MLKRKPQFILVPILTVVLTWACSQSHTKPSSRSSTEPSSLSSTSSQTNLDNYHDCPMEGTAANDSLKTLNRLKNRYTAPIKINPQITLEKILQPGDDRTRWNPSDGATLSGYVYDVKKGGVETCNCKTTDEDYRDTHIELVLDPMSTAETDRVIVEVTPRLRELMKRRGTDWSTRTLRDRILGRWVRVTGWMLFDQEHTVESENTAPGRERNWRRSAWELHPLSAIEVLPGRPDRVPAGSGTPVGTPASSASTNHPTTVSAQVIGNKNSKVYHLKGCPGYDQVAEKNRVLFDSEEAAQAAGYRKAGNCP